MIVVEGRESGGRTDAEGFLEAWVNPAARQGELRIDGEPPLQILLGRLLPVTEQGGVVDRLVNLGHLAADDVDDSEQLRRALLAFQTLHTLTPSGQVDDQTRKALAEAYGC